MANKFIGAVAAAFLLAGSAGFAMAAGSQGGQNTAQPRVSRTMQGLPTNSQSSAANTTGTASSYGAPAPGPGTQSGVTSGASNGAPEANGARVSPAMPSNTGNGDNGGGSAGHS